MEVPFGFVLVDSSFGYQIDTKFYSWYLCIIQGIIVNLIKNKKASITINAELRDYTNSKGVRQVDIRITQNKKHVREKTGISVKSTEWDGKIGKWINSKNPNYKKLNLVIQEKISAYQNKYYDLEKEQGLVDKRDVFNAINKAYVKRDFLSFWDAKRAEMKNYNNYKGYDTTRAKIIEFEGSESFDFKVINEEWLGNFEDWLRDKGLCAESVHTQQKRIRKIWNMAVKAQIVDRGMYPFGRNGYTLPNISVKSKSIQRLDADELKRFFKLNYQSDNLIYFVHKGFELSFNCAGIRIEDLLTLRWSNIKNGRISYNMKKGITNGKLKSFAITPSIQSILNGLKTNSNQSNGYILPFLKLGIEQRSNEEYKKEIGRKTSLYNNYLKKIAKDIGTDKNLTSHLARHSWAAYAYEKTKDLKLIQENLDQNDIKVTMGYIGRLSTKQNDDKLNSLYSELYY